MTSNYVEIRKENIRKYGEETRHLAFLGELYSDRTHFIYELLQNAEDARASAISITLHRNRLELLHDGKSFDEADVEGICAAGKGTKSEDSTKIGRFGIGFKSVYAYTNAPQVHSGDEHFRIDHYVRPFEIDPIEVPKPWTTRLILPFNSSATSDTAFDEIATRLKDLNVRTLLFLRSIEQIAWWIDTNESGLYIRVTKHQETARTVTLIREVDDESEAEEEWLVFERAIEGPNCKMVRPIELAFLLESQTQNGPKEIIATQGAPLFVSFATEKKTNLGFLLQGPYETTPARDNIQRDSQRNKYLLKESSEHLISVLQTLKEMDMLTVRVLETLPIEDEEFQDDSMFRPLYDRVAKALAEDALLPALGSGFIRGCDAVIGRGEDIRNLLSADQLRSLHGDDTQNLAWLSEKITQERVPVLHRYLMNELDIEEITPDSFARKVTEKFFSEQSDEWFVQLYRFLLRQEALWRTYYGPIRHKPFIRLSDDRQICPFKEDGSVAAYLPCQGGRQLPTVKPELVENSEAKEFLVKLGIHKPDIVSEVLEHVLPLYEPDEIEVSREDHKEHIELILTALEVDSIERREELISRLRESHCLLGRNADTNEEDWMPPRELFTRSGDLSVFLKGNPEAYFLDEQYTEDQIDAFLELGVSNRLGIQRREKDRKGRVTVRNFHGLHERGLGGFDPDFTVEHLEHAVQFPNVERSLFIWRNIAIPQQRQIRGTVETSTRQSYENSERELRRSKLGETLLSNRWLPDSGGTFHKPSELSLADLHEDFDRDEGLAAHLEMKDSELLDLAKQSGAAVDGLNLLRKLQEKPGGLQKLEELVEQMEQKPSFPERPSTNTERRKERAQQGAKTAPRKEYERRPRSTRTSQADGDKNTYLKENYTNRDGELICQICEYEMPFRRRDGEHYFESVQLFDDLSREHTAAHLALCPICAAKYKEFVKRDSDNATLVCKSIRTSEEFAVPVNLGQDVESIRFVEKHLWDVRAVLEEELV